MAFVENFLAPFTQFIISLATFGLLMFGIYSLVIKFAGDKVFNLKMWWKYSYKKTPYDENMVLWAMEMIEENTPQELLKRKFYISNKFNLGEFEEGMYVYYKTKQLKGGL